MAGTRPQVSSEIANHYSTRMVAAFRYVSLAIAGVGLIQAVVFALMGLACPHQVVRFDC
jgi:hypothetical protein